MERKRSLVSAVEFLFTTLRPRNIVVLFSRKFSIFILTIVAAILGGFFWWQWAIQPASSLKPAPPKIFVVQKGESLTSVADRLDKENIIRSSLAFKIMVLTKDLAGQIQAGDFRLRPSSITEEIVYILTHGSLDIWLTFPEGWRREEFGRRLEANLEEFNYQEFLELTKDIEGYLFPDTYLIPKDASPSAAIGIFTNNFDKKFNPDLEAAAKIESLTKKQVTVFASIVEREARNDEDRSLVAGILLKRWRKNWPLQADATVQYAKANKIISIIESIDAYKEFEWWEPVKKSDLEIDSPYNTYKYKGIPPTPICNPGLATIKAVIYPEKSDYWFYLADSSGTVHYAKTNEEHNENIEKYLK